MKAEYITFWILVLMIVGLAIWKLVGSPTDTAALITTTLFIVGSEILLWKALFSIDKKTSIGFIKMKSELSNNFKDVNNRLTSIEGLITKRKR